MLSIESFESTHKKLHIVGFESTKNGLASNIDGSIKLFIERLARWTCDMKSSTASF